MDNNETTGDEALLAALQHPDTREAAFTTVVHRYGQRLYWHIRKMVLSHDDANDVLQNTFVKVWNNLDGFRGESQLFTWLYRIASNEAINFIKASKRLRNLSLSDAAGVLGNLTATDSYFNADRAQFLLQQAILTLPEKQRLVFNMRYFEEMPYEQMADILQTSVGALKASYHHAMKKVEKILKPD